MLHLDRDTSEQVGEPLVERNEFFTGGMGRRFGLCSSFTTGAQCPALDASINMEAQRLLFRTQARFTTRKP